ncbi:MAG: ABC transporter substrate-binding protein [Actinomycetota bacterium]|nr:ABC transporter substrate-binding protein [Actinomycetota bacterium]
MRRKTVIVALLMGLVATACGGGSSSKSSSPGSTVATAAADPNAVVNIAGPEDQWPVQGTGTGAQATTFAYPFNVNVYEPLIYLASDFTLKPGLAESWELLNGTTWRFHLRHGVTFHDGKAFNADDVMWTWADRQMRGKTLATVVNTLGPDSVKKIDDFTVDFTPKTPNNRLPEQIVHPEGAIVEQNKDFDASPDAGTGPFKVVSYTAGQTVVLDRFDGYWGTKAQVQRMNIRFLPDPQTRLEALKSGQVDLIVDMPANATASIESDKAYRLVKSKPGRNFLIYVNKTDGRVTADQAVRQAVALSINTKDYTQVVFEGNADPGHYMAPEAVLGSSASLVKAPPFDPKQAATLLDQAGWKPGSDGIRAKDGKRLTVKLLGQADTPAGSGEFIQSQLKAVGIETQLIATPDTATRNTLYSSGKGDFDLDLEGPNQNDGNPAFLPVLRMYSKNPNTAQFAPGADFDALAEKTFTAPTTAEVQNLSAQMMKILTDDTYLNIPLAGVYRIFAMSSKVNLTDPHPSNTNQTWFSLTKTK